VNELINALPPGIGLELAKGSAGKTHINSVAVYAVFFSMAIGCWLELLGGVSNDLPNFAAN